MTNRYDEEIKKIKKEEIPKYIAAIYTSRKFMKLTGIEERSIDRLLDYVMRSDKTISQRSDKVNAIQRKLSKQKQDYNFVSRQSIEDALDKKLERRPEIDWSERHEIVSQIQDNATKAFLNYLKNYMSAVRSIERLENQKKEEIKREQERAQKERDEERKRKAEETKRKLAEAKQATEQSYHPTPSSYEFNTPTYSPPRTYEYHKIEEQEFTDPEIHEQRKNTAEKIINTIESKYSYQENGRHNIRVYLSDEERKLLTRALNGRYPYEIEEYIEKAYTMQNILERFSYYDKNRLNPLRKDSYEPKYEDLIEYAETVLEVLPKELTSREKYDQEGTIKSHIGRKTKINHSLENYQKVYDIFVKYFNKLKPEERENIKKRYNNPSKLYINEALNIRGFEIPEPNKLKGLVNNKVSEILIKRYDYYSKTSIIETYTSLKKATIYMTPEEVARIYSLSDNEVYYIPYGFDEKTKEEQERILEEIKERRANLQRLYADVIKDKLPNELKKDKTDKEIYKYICENYFHTELIFEVYEVTEEKEPIKPTTKNGDGITEEKSYINADGEKVYVYKDNDGIQETTNPTLAARHYAHHRYYGLSKFKKTMAEIIGTWDKFITLADTIDEGKYPDGAKEQLDRMFK